MTTEYDIYLNEMLFLVANNGQSSAVFAVDGIHTLTQA